MQIIHLFKLLAVCAVLGAGFVRSQEHGCPSIGNEKLEPYNEYNKETYEETMKKILASRPGPGVDFVKNMANDKCVQPEEPSDYVPEEKPKSSRAKRAIQAIVQPLKNTCEPCPPRVYSLRRFYGNCYVIYPWIQNVRYVRCNKRCDGCQCTHSYCQRTSYRKSWFLSYCFSNPPGAFTRGWNFRFLYLPQDCTCHQHHHNHKG